MRNQRRCLRTLFCCLVALSIPTSLSSGGAPANAPPFQYAGGTEEVQQNCAGVLEVTSEALIFKCPLASLTLPFSSITLMEYRPNLSRRVGKLELEWRVRPYSGAGKKNRYFTVVYKTKGATHVVVLKVSPRSMRPYLAEIELKSGKRVEVMGYEEYQEP
jgi:hypothetical protein